MSETPGEIIRRLSFATGPFDDSAWDAVDVDWPEPTERQWPAGSSMATLLADCVVWPDALRDSP